MTVTILAHVDHRLAPMEHPAVARAIAAILTGPCYRDLTRVHIAVKDRRKGHVPITADAIATYLLGPETDSVHLDSGRTGDRVAAATIDTGRAYGAEVVRDSYVVVPYVPEEREAILASFVELARALDALTGYVTLEPSYRQAFATALCKAPRREDYPDHPRRRAQERRAHFRHQDKLDTELAGPDWGVFLSRQHLERLAPTRDRWAPLVHITPVGDDRVFVQLTPDPMDVLEPGFDAVLERARRDIFAPILMDVSQVPLVWDFLP